MTGVHQLVQTFLDQCKTGNFAELRLTGEGGRLKASMFADLGPLRPEFKPKSDDFGKYGGRVSPSRVRRTEKRAAERQLFATAGETTAEKARETDQVAAAGNAADDVKVIAENAAPWKVSTEEAAALKAAAVSEMTVMNAAGVFVEKAEGEIDASWKAGKVENVEAGKLDVNCSAETAETKCDVLSDTETASTSTKLMIPEHCCNCEAVFTPAHQCDGSPEPVSEAPLAPKPPDPTETSVDPGRTFAPRRGLNINTFCRRCEQRHPARQKCQ